MATIKDKTEDGQIKKIGILDGLFLEGDREVLVNYTNSFLDYFIKYIPSSGNLIHLNYIVDNLKKGKKLEDIVKDVNKKNYSLQYKAIVNYFSAYVGNQMKEEEKVPKDFTDDVNSLGGLEKRGESLEGLIKKYDIKAPQMLKKLEIEPDELRDFIGEQRKVQERILFNLSYTFSDNFFKGRKSEIFIKYIWKIISDGIIEKELRQRLPMTIDEQNIISDDKRTLYEKEGGIPGSVLISNKIITEYKNRKGKTYAKKIDRGKGFGLGSKVVDKYRKKKVLGDNSNITFVVDNKGEVNKIEQKIINFINDPSNKIQEIPKEGQQDYKKEPKDNKYTSVHKTLYYEGLVIEVQIRTKKQHNIAIYGSANHLEYKKQKAIEISNSLILEMMGLMPYFRNAVFNDIEKKVNEEYGKGLIKEEKIEEEILERKAKVKYKDFLKEIKKIIPKDTHLNTEFSETTVKEIYKKLRSREELKSKRIDEEKPEYGKGKDIFNTNVSCSETEIETCVKSIKELLEYINGHVFMPFSNKQKLYAVFVEAEKP